MICAFIKVEAATAGLVSDAIVCMDGDGHKRASEASKYSEEEASKR